MPYILPDRRRLLLTGETPPRNIGELNFLITDRMLQYLKWHDINYTTINAVLGALEAAKLEFYRRVAVPYEDEKIKENGDVYP